MADHYAELGIAVGATQDEIRRAYRTLALQNHPDKTLLLGAEERATREANFKRVSGAYEVLSDAEKRAAYDAKIARTSSQPPGSYSQHTQGRHWGERRSEAHRAQRRAERRERKRKREEAARRREERYYQDIHIPPEDTRYTSHPYLMGSDHVSRTFGPWSYELRFSRLFQLRDNTEPAESSNDLASELHIALKIDAQAPTPDSPDTEDVWIKISRAPGAIQRFETYLKERSDGSCILILSIYVDAAMGLDRLPLELPVDLRLNTNWVPFSQVLNPAVRATRLRFYGEEVEVPDDAAWDDGDGEMRDAEVVDVGGEGRRWVRIGSRRWKRVAAVGFVRKWW